MKKKMNPLSPKKEKEQKTTTKKKSQLNILIAKLKEQYPTKNIGTCPLVLAQGQRRTDAVIIFSDNALNVLAVIDPRNEEHVMLEAIKVLNKNSIIFDPYKAPIYFGKPKDSFK